MEIKEFFTAMIIGDAIGTASHGLSKGHVQNLFKNQLNNFPDTDIIFKKEPYNWRKSGLYSSVSQFTVLSAASIITRTKFSDVVLNLIKVSELVDETSSAFFRLTDHTISQQLFELSVNGKCAGIFSHSSVIIFAGSVTSLVNHHNEKNVVAFIKDWTHSAETAIAALVYSHIIKYDIDTSVWENVISSIKNINEWVVKESAYIFDMGYNPDYLIKEAENYLSLARLLEGAFNTAAGEKIIVDFTNVVNKKNITRATVDMPMVQLFFSLTLSRFIDSENLTVFSAVQNGGTSQIISPMFLTMAVIQKGLSFIPGFLTDNLVNKKKIFLMIDKISMLNISQTDINDFQISESQLTKKEIEEKLSKTKHCKKKNNEKNTKVKHKTLEEKLSQHVVESWTKLDKAKWKKQRNKVNAEQ